MKRLNAFEEAWRNYLFANRDGLFNDVSDFFIRVELISDSHEQILETILNNTPSMELIDECKGEIAFQRNQLEDTINEFVQYADNADDEVYSANELLDDICNAGTKNFLYVIASDWQEWGSKANKIYEKLYDTYGYGLGYIHDDLCKLVLNEVLNTSVNQPVNAI